MYVASGTDTTRWPGSMSGIAERVKPLDRDRRIEDVVANLLEIERERDGYRNPRRRSRRPRLRRPQGVAAFNFMYLSVTEEVGRSLDRFAEPAFVERLAVVFAEFYLLAHEAAEAGQWVSKAWEPLFEPPGSERPAPIQYALAGMNAHINNDLAWALLQTWAEFDVEPATDSPEYRDFELVNDILDRVAGKVRARLESGVLRWLDRLFGRMDDLVASFVIGRARDEAWRRGARWRSGIDPEAAAAHERHVGFESHLILAA